MEVYRQHAARGGVASDDLLDPLTGPDLRRGCRGADVPGGPYATEVAIGRLNVAANAGGGRAEDDDAVDVALSGGEVAEQGVADSELLDGVERRAEIVLSNG